MSLQQIIVFAFIALMAIHYVVHPPDDPDDPEGGWIQSRSRITRRSFTYKGKPKGRRIDECPNGTYINKHHKLVVDNPDNSYTQTEAFESCQYAQQNRQNEPMIHISTMMMGQTTFVEASGNTCINLNPLPVYECRINQAQLSVKPYKKFCHWEHHKAGGHVIVRTLRCTDSLEEPIVWMAWDELIEIEG